MRSFIQDLDADIKDIDTVFKLGEVVTEKLDSLVYILNEKDPQQNANTVYKLAHVGARIVQVVFHDRTSSQLKNSGNMRLIRNSKLSDAIQDYWTQVKVDDEIARRMEDILSKAGDVGVQIFSNKYFKRLSPSNPFLVSVSDGARLINSDPKLIVQLSNHCNSRLVVLYNYLLHLTTTKEMALQLIELTKNEYHLK